MASNPSSASKAANSSNPSSSRSSGGGSSYSNSRHQSSYPRSGNRNSGGSSNSNGRRNEHWDDKEESLSSSRTSTPSNSEYSNMRISKLARTMARLESQESFAKSCSQIEELIQNSHENKKYVVRSLHCLLIPFGEVIQGLTNTSWRPTGIVRYSNFLVCVTKSLETQYSRLVQWLVEFMDTKAQKSKGSQHATTTQAVIEAMIPQLSRQHNKTLINSIQGVLETATNAEMFNMYCSIYVHCLTPYEDWKIPHFQNFVDVVIGWMLDPVIDEKPSKIIPRMCEKILKSLEPFFLNDLEYTKSLLVLLMEDLAHTCQGLSKNNVQSKIMKTTHLLRAYSNVVNMKCNFENIFYKSSCEGAFAQVYSFLQETSQFCSRKLAFDLVRGMIEFIFTCRGMDGIIRDFLKEILKCLTEKNRWQKWPMMALNDFLLALSTWIETVVTFNRPDPGVTEIFAQTMKYLDAVEPHYSAMDEPKLVRIVHCLLRTRNVVLLQTVYEWVVGKLNDIRKIDTSDEDDAQKAIDGKMFVLACLADVATNKTGSILSLWALSPPIIEVLMGLAQDSGNVKLSALKLLRSHCSTHSHFVSSIALSRSYLAESPGTQFLHNLLKFWKEKLLIEEHSPNMELWMFSWISHFITSSAQYLSLLLESEKDFYEIAIREFLRRPSLQEPLVDLLSKMMRNAYYKKSDFIVDLIRNACLKILLPSSVSKVKSKYLKLYQSLPFVLVLEPETQDGDSIENSQQTIAKVPTSYPTFRPFTATEFNYFIHDFFITNKNEASLYSDGKTHSSIRGAVEHMIQSKLRSTIGRPQDFFYHLQNMLKKYRVAKTKMPKWKIAFIYELERRIVSCIYTNCLESPVLPENVRTFYHTNKTPCMEWLKRMRSDLADITIRCQDYPSAFYFASLAGDDLKARYAMLELGDVEGLAGLQDMAGFHYLKEEYEDVLEVLNGMELDMVTKKIKSRTDAVLRLACGDSKILKTKSQKAGPIENPVYKIPTTTATFLNTQFENMRGHLTFPPRGIQGQLKDISGNHTLDLFKVYTAIKGMREISAVEKLKLECTIVNRMIELGNTSFVRDWLTKHRNFSGVAGQMQSNNELKMDYFLILAEYLARTSSWGESAKMYVNLCKLLESVENNELFKSQALIKLMKNLVASDDFFQSFVRERELPCAPHDNLKEPVIYSVLDAAVSMAPTNAECWLDFGDFSYSRGQTEESSDLQNLYKAQASTCYTNVMKSVGTSKQTRMSLFAMTRLIKLHKEGIPFQAEAVIIDSKALALLPELANIEEFRPYLLKRFPEEASFVIATYARPRKFRRFSQRRSLFDGSCFAFTEINEEILQTFCQNQASCQVPTEDTQLEIEIEVDLESIGMTELRKLIPLKLLTFVEEMDRVGTSREELWSWSLQRVGADWMKRCHVLRRDISDQSENEKVMAYVTPVLAFLTELWEGCQQCDSPSELAFLCRFGEKINSMLSTLAKCVTIDQFEEIQSIFLKFVEQLDAYNFVQTAIGNLSSRLANFDFGNLSEKISIPGFPPGVAISRIHNLVTCLTTKTKPKRLAFEGTDGKKYEYLVKGNENLNIDCRIMQFLKAVEIFTGNTTRTYSVTPLGERGGLIQIVKGATPMFDLYRRHLSENNIEERPSEMYWRKLEEEGAYDRSKKEPLIKVFDILQKETSSELLSRQIFLCARTAKEWLESTRTFTQDCAMGSCVGYIAGIGDRHLDNILFNPFKGELIHVDFSILFGKGASLRIPEKVPFRLTQNFVAALQYPALPGPFHANLTKLLYNFGKEKEAMIFFLESIAFAYQLEEALPIDPKKLLLAELKSTLRLFHHRATENADAMQEVRRNILATCLEEQQTTNAWASRQEKISMIEKVTKKVFLWRRLLYCLDPLIQFIVSYAQPIGSLKKFKEIVIKEWNPNVMHFWCHVPIEEIVCKTSAFSKRFEFTEIIIRRLVEQIPQPGEVIKPKEIAFTCADFQIIDQGKIESVMEGVRERIGSVSSVTATELIAEATSKENLAQMYEGWTPWV